MNADLKRRRQPALVRTALLDAVIQEAVLGGLASVTVLGVAARAGVSKGALFHHFPSRQVLLEAAYAECLLRFGSELDACMARDAVEAGRFTRAYVTATFEAMTSSDRSWARFSLTALVEPAFADLWREWLAQRLENAPSERLDPRQRAARLAADGFWLQMLSDPAAQMQPDQSDALLACILTLTSPA
ncbi:TetR/AcrR family transcriptional regulator [Stenotrophomonas sp.]|uniref:TetR/AcrR family transcriptional regulator n=1 Tax=Stenotrophomonas sp. TaxID=69392 RepID=UPI0028AB95C5|nr:TetR/AcrR family transcriptional regulator [Stenotrophomonas sp.]